MRNRRWLIVFGIVTALVLAGGAAIVFTHSSTTTGRQQQSGDAEHGIEGPGPRGADAATAAQHALTAIFTSQPVTDASPGMGLSRARPWLIGDLAAEADAPPATDVRPLPDWASWRSARDVINATVVVTATHPPDQGECQVIATVTQIIQHTNGSTTAYQTMTVSAITRQSENGWRLAAYRVLS